MDPLRLTSCQASSADGFVASLAHYLADRLQIPIQSVGSVGWVERLRQFDAGEIQVCWLCGASYVRRADLPNPQIECLVAPVMMHPRYQNCPIYYSDVVVRQDSSFDSFKDLRGCTWAINEPASHSGCWITRYHLACLGETVGFFGKVLQSGAHQISLQWILQNKIDAAAIDSTVLEFVLAQDPAMAAALRIIDSWGPSPIPPWLIHRHVPAEIRTALRETLTHMHRDPVGQQILRKGQTARFVSVQDRDYDPLRQMLQVGSGVMLNLDPVDRHPTATTPGILKQAKDL